VIKVRRLPAPEILDRQAESWTRELCEARETYYRAVQEKKEVTSDPPYPEARRSRYAHREIKARLEEMFGKKCAYCESLVAAVSYLHVEHFRPQSIFPAVAYTWSNLLLACERCNSGHKGDQFPLRDGSQPWEDPAHPCSIVKEDDQLLVDPCRDEPSEFFAFRDATLVCHNARGEVMRDVCGLNREDLMEMRRIWLVTAVETALKACQLAARLGLEAEKAEFRQRLRRLLQPSMPYVAMTRARLADSGVDPDGL